MLRMMQPPCSTLHESCGMQPPCSMLHERCCMYAATLILSPNEDWCVRLCPSSVFRAASVQQLPCVVESSYEADFCVCMQVGGTQRFKQHSISVSLADIWWRNALHIESNSGRYVCSCCSIHMQRSCCIVHIVACMLQHPCCGMHVAASMLWQACCSLHVVVCMLQRSCCRRHAASLMLWQACCSLHDVACILQPSCCCMHNAAFMLLHACFVLHECVPRCPSLSQP
jgi:hypothetical protein